MNELRMFHERYTKARKKLGKGEPNCSTSPPLSDLLPPRAICDQAVNSYFKTFEKNFRILHRPFFMDEYGHFWELQEHGRDEFKPFVPQLVVVVAINQAMEDASACVSDSDTRAVDMCSHVEAWIDSLPGRKQLTLATLRTRALLIIAQQVRVSRADEVWKATGSLMRSAMVAGFHRDPSEFPEIPVFEGEMRRRLWMTIVEMDLATSLIYGMPIMLHEGDFTCKSPANLNDIDLFENMIVLPPPKLADEATDSIFQVALAVSLPLRHRAMSRSGTQLEDMREQIHALEDHVRHLPSNLRPSCGKDNDLGKLLGVVLLNVHIRRVLSHLYRSSASWADLVTGYHAGLQSSLSILSYQSLFDPESSDTDTDARARYWNLFHILCRNDIMQAALDVCLHAQAPGLVSWTKAGLLLAIDDTISSLMRRISKNGSDIKDITRLSVIAQLLRSQSTQTDREFMMQEGARNVLMACRNAAGHVGVWTEVAEHDKVGIQNFLGILH
jgi:Fungal specific transcription factor domain